MKLLLCTTHSLLLQSRCFSCGVHLASWSSQTVRSTFIDYFKKQKHVFVPSSTVIPKKGEGTYFTNAGMNQFKPLILGELDHRSKYQGLVRAVNSQKCIRIGGKHNDLEDVGHDLTHHTFFEMLGNWSFGDYFKADMCQMAFTLLTKHYGISADRLYFTYFSGDEYLNLPSDDECKQIWHSLGIPENRVLPFGVKDNFWDMGMTGPCGPCTEIHYDHVGSRDASVKVNTGSSDVVEIWNLVFMQYSRQKDQSLKQLKSFHVDTGMGLERLTAVLNGTKDNYSTDLFIPLFEVIHKHARCPPYQSNKEVINTNYRLLADHARMFTVAIADGLLPSQDNLGHKLRTIINRCIHLCNDVFQGSPEILLPKLASAVVQSLGTTYPELIENEQRVCQIVVSSVEHHDRQRDQAIKTFSKMTSKLGHIKELSAEVIMALEKGTYGNTMSIELISEQAKTNELKLDMVGYEKLQHETMVVTASDPLVLPPDPANALVTELMSRQVPPTNDAFKYHYMAVNDTEYDFSQMYSATCPSHVEGLSSNGEMILRLEADDQGEVILDRTCFYAESGGQEGDTGKLVSETGEFCVDDVQCLRGYVVHYGHVTSGYLQVGQAVDSTISQASRLGCMCNHTATHLLNSALAEVVPSIHQQGSSVTPYKLTLDFHTLSAIGPSDIKMVEDEVRDAIKREFQVTRRVMPLDLALQLNKVKTLKNEEYPSVVSVITVESHDDAQPISTELCCGTHVCNTGHLGDFCITNLTTKALNVKRVTCVTGREAEQARCQGSVVESLCHILQTLVEGRQVSHMDLEKLSSLTQQAVALIDSSVERLQHSHTFSCEDKSRLRDLIEENDKALDLCETCGTTVDQLMLGSVEPEHIMKQLVTCIRKGSLLDLIPKTVRAEAHVYLENLEYKVAEAVNKRGIKLLQQMLERQMEENSSDMSPVMLQFDDVDIGPRQVVKLLSQKAWNKLVVLVQKSSRTVNVVVSLPLSSVQDTKGELDKIFELLSCFGVTKGKLASEKKNTVVYTVSIQADVDSLTVMRRLREEKFFER